MAGLNLSHELVRLQGDSGADRDIIDNRTSELVDRISKTLAAHKQLSL